MYGGLQVGPTESVTVLRRIHMRGIALPSTLTRVAQEPGMPRKKPSIADVRRGWQTLYLVDSLSRRRTTLLRQHFPHTAAKQLLHRQLSGAVSANQDQLPVKGRASQTQDANGRLTLKP